MNTFIFTKAGEKQFKKLDKTYQERVINKLKFLKNHENIDLLLKFLESFYPATHRLRIGNIRVILKKEKTTFYILDIGNRGDIYK